jgi:hypothetical protein
MAVEGFKRGDEPPKLLKYFNDFYTGRQFDLFNGGYHWESRVRGSSDQSKTPPGGNPRRGSAPGTRKRATSTRALRPAILVAQGHAVVPV